MSGTGQGGDYSNEVTVCIKAPLARVWEALTTPVIIKQWFFGVDTETDWRVGSPVVHRGNWQGRDYEDKGVILAFEPPRLLAHSHWSPFSGRPDRPENYERVTFTLAERAGKTDLTIRESNLPSAQARSTSEKTWRMVLRNLKKLVEESSARR